MDSFNRELIPHVIVMIALYAFFLTISASLFGYGDIWAALAIGVAILYGYKPTAVAFGVAPQSWVKEVESREKKT